MKNMQWNGGCAMDDLISRAAAIKAFTGKPPEYYHTDYIVSELGRLPTADAVPVVHGRWQEYHATVHGYGKIYYQHSCTPILYESPYYYCPHCGAKMDGEWRDDDGKVD